MVQNKVLGEDGTVPAASVLAAPHGLQNIIATFGDIYTYIHADGTLDPGWYADELARVALPFPLQLAWDMTTCVSQMTCHKLLCGTFTSLMQNVQARGLQAEVKTLGGCFSFRPQRNSSKLSTHAWGIAIDLNPGTNAQGSAGDMDERVIRIFEDAGFCWGGAWPGLRRDPMHFQFCTGY